MVANTCMPSVGRFAVMATAVMGMASAHMHIKSPAPLEGYSPKDPLDPSGSNFPCHGAPLPTSGGQKLTAGSTFPLELELNGGANTAVHGGGSCQLAVTYETDSEKARDPSNWHVIYSIEGGCPANTEGNLVNAVQCSSDDEGDCVHSWDVPMPKGIQSGHAILSWTWFNTIGNREMYQNCVNVNIEGGSGEDMGSFPPLFVANLANVNDCSTSEQTDVLFPNPGNAVTTMSAAGGKNYPKATPSGACGGSGGSAPKPTYGSGEESSPEPTSSSETEYSAPATSQAQAEETQAYTNYQPATTLATKAATTSAPIYDGARKGKTDAPASFPATTAAASSADSYSSPEPSAPASAPAAADNETTSYGGSDDGECTDGAVACPEDGAVFCISETQWGMCNWGCAVPQALSAGTVCADGVISGAKVSRHVARHAHGLAHKY